jgi:hypothetical protein
MNVEHATSNGEWVHGSPFSHGKKILQAISKKMILYVSGGPAGGQPFEKVAKHAFFCPPGFLIRANNKWR